ncbi:hypothetical protein CONLIGDRAFT_685913 [Coniochaeta ligniaria NRRL 30616]|uniref:Uncharacterized protein n=1 Tax=Coniochaeta ligniaria NRRL 30616 TaxID=1408157 RepID=A0A1J7IA12_9PEZI|nr:hypothetical protein CONLIGDRAFT_685913 [Coniochaeta ligniaria NRRL 30616]
MADFLAPEFTLPALRGEENLHEWNTGLIQILKIHGAVDYVLKTSAEVEKKDLLKCSVLILISRSISQVADRLANAGWDLDALDALDKDPKDLYDFIHCTISMTEATVGGLVHEFTHIKPAQFTSFNAFLIRVQHLKRHLDEMDCAIGENAAIWIVVDAIKDDHPDFHKILVGLIPSLDWIGLMEVIASIGIFLSAHHGTWT